jgi:hypothetical protein
MLEVFEDTEDIEEDYDDDVADQDYVCTGNSDTSDDEEMLTKVYNILYIQFPDKNVKNSQTSYNTKTKSL